MGRAGRRRRRSGIIRWALRGEVDLVCGNEMTVEDVAPVSFQSLKLPPVEFIRLWTGFPQSIFSVIQSDPKAGGASDG